MCLSWKEYDMTSGFPNKWQRVPPEELLAHHESAPSELRSNVSLAAALAGTGKTAEVLEKLYEVIMLDPKNARAFSVLGAIQADRGQKEEALEAMRQAVRLAPDDYASHWGLGFMLHKYGQREEARVELAAVVSLVNKAAEDMTIDKIQLVNQRFFASEAQKLLDTL